MIKPEIATGFRQMILSRIPMSKQEPADQQAILDMPFRDLLSTFYNWQNRRVSIRPRAVHISQELRAKNRTEVAVLADKIKKGEDLNPHLSERVETVFLATPKDPGLRYREDLDLLLNEWAIHHLHISTILQPNGFVGRGRELLFAAFRHDDAYLIDLLDHKAFEDENLVQIATTNWPNAKLFSVTPGMKLLFPDTKPGTKPSRKQLRNAGVNTPVQLSTGIAGASAILGSGQSALVELKINHFLAKVINDQDRCSLDDILKAMTPALDFHPFSDR
jgi:hypothetical protein